MSRVDDVAAELMAEQEQNSQLRLDDNVRMSLNTDAEKRLKAEHLAQVIGEPDVDFVERNYATVERSARTRGLYNALPADSVTRNILSDPRERASLPDAENLAKIEGSITSFGNVAPSYRKGQDVHAGGKQAFQMMVSGSDDATYDTTMKSYNDRMDRVQYGDLNWAQRVPGYSAEMAGLYSRMLPEAGMAAAYAGAGATMAAGPEAAPPAALAGFKIGTTKEMFEVEAGWAFDEFRGLKFDATGMPVDRDAAVGAAILVGGINAGLEFIGLNAAVLHAYGLPQLIKSLGKGGVKNLLNNPAARDAFSKIGQDYAVGMLTEGTTEALQELAVIGFGDLLKGSYSGIEAYGARMWESFQAGAGGAAGIAAPGAAIRSTGVAMDNRKQKQQQDAIAALGEDIKTSKLYSNAPKKFQEFIRNIQARHGTVDTVYMDAEAAQTYFQNIDQQVLEKDMPETAIALREALDTGGYVAIPLDEFVTYVAPNMADVSQDITFDPLTPTQRQYQEIESKAKELQDWYEKTQGQIDQAEDPVYGQVYTELLGAGRKADVAEKEAMLFTTMIRRMADRVGMDPEEYYRSKKISIRGELIQQEGIDVPTATGGLINLLREGRGPRQKDVFGPSLIEFLMGTGILDEGGELSARDLEKQIPAYGRRRLARESGVSMTEAFERARDAGYLDLGENVSEESALLAAIDRELGGNRVYSPNQLSSGAQELDTALEQLRELIDRAELDINTMTNEEIMDRLQEVSSEGALNQNGDYQQFKDTERAYGGKTAYEKAKEAGLTKLNYVQWVQVRTPAFKAWFGDWEAAGRQSAWRSVIDRALDDRQWQTRTLVAEGRDADPSGKLSEAFGFEVIRQYITPDDLRKSEKRHGDGNEKFPDQIGLKHDDYVKALEVLRDPDTYRNSTSRNKKPSAEFGRAFSDGTIVVAEVETAEDGALSIKSVWKKVPGRIHAGAESYPNRKTSEVAAGTGISVSSDSLIVNPDTVSKVTDPETGEPLVVYHGTDADIESFDAAKLGLTTGAKSAAGGFFFSNSPEMADFYPQYGLDLLLEYGGFVSSKKEGESRADYSKRIEENNIGARLDRAQSAADSAYEELQDAVFESDDAHARRVIDAVLSNRLTLPQMDAIDEIEGRAEKDAAIEAAHAENRTAVAALAGPVGEAFRRYADLQSARDRLEADYTEWSRRYQWSKQAMAGGNQDGETWGAKKDEPHPNTMAVYLAIQNPLIHDFGGKSYRDVSYAQLIEDAKAAGHDGLILRNTADPTPGDVYVAFNPTQIKSSTGNNGTFDPNNPNILYQPGDTPSTRLSAIHSLTSENLLFADNMGGLAVPSIAVVKEGMAHSGYGEITLIGTEDLGNPEKVTVYDSDAYTSTFPRPEYPKVKSSTAQSLVNAIRDWVTKYEGKRGYVIDATWDYAVNNPNPEKVVQEWMRSNGVKAMFLSDVGAPDTKVVMRDVALSYPESKHPAVVAFFKEHPSTDYSDEMRKALAGPLTQAIHETYKDVRALRDKMVDSALDDEGAVNHGPFSRLMRDHENVGKREVDEYATADRLNKKLKGKEAEFQAWVNEKVLAMYGDPFLKVKGKKKPYTLENIVDYMTHGGTQAKEKNMTFGEGMARATAAKKFTDLEWMRNEAEWKILPESEIKAGREKAQELMEEYRQAVIDYYTVTNYRGDPDTWGGLDASMKVMAEWAKSRMKLGDKAAMKAALRKNDFKGVPDEIIQMGAEAGQAMMSAPLPYFEAKPERAVKLDEFVGAVVPDDVSQEVLDVLGKHGIRVQKYGARYDEGARESAVGALTQSLHMGGSRVLFQDKTKPRGYLEVSPQRLVVTLTKSANLSTFIHESGHLFLELMKDATALADVDPQLLADWETVKAYLGAGSEPPVRAGHTRVYHSGSQGEGNTGRWVSTDRTYAANYRADLPLFYVDLPVDDPRVNNPDYADQGVRQGFTFNFELTPQESALLVEIPRGGEITREQHETFARSFEAYLMEGKAPTKELAGLFSRFKSWLIGVYKTLNKLDVELTDDIRAVFDRMLVAEAAIERAADDIVPAFKGGKDLPEAEINALMELQRQALRAGQDEMEAQAQAEIRAMRTEAYRNRRDALTREVTAKIDAKPVYAVQRLLRTGNDENMTVPDHLLGKKLSSQAVINLFLDAKVLRRIPGLTRKEGGAHPDVLADLYGFESGYHMVQQIIAAPPRSEVIRSQVQAQLDEEFGNMAQDTETIERAALALHNNAMANFLVAEARAMNRKLGRKDNVTLNQATKEAARRHVARLKLRQIRPHAYYQAELKAARASQEAIAAGKFEEAAQLKQQQLLNHHLYREARMAIDRADLIRRKLKKYDSASVMQNIRKGDPIAANGIEALLAGVELKKTALTQIDARNRLAQYVQAMEAQGEAVLIDPALYEGADLVNYREMTLEQLEALDSSVAALAKQGRDANKIRVEGELVEMAQVIEDLNAVASTNLTAKQINQYDVDHRSPLTKAFSSFLASLRKIEFECRFADGDIVGKWHRTIFQPFVDAQNAKEEMLSSSVAELQSIMGTLSRQDAQRLNQSINFLGTTLNRGDLYVVALNMGNEGNWDRLFSRRWKGQERQVLAKLQDELTLEDFRRIEALGQMIDRMYEPMAAVSERVDGIRPPKVEAKPLYLAKYGIELSGWYYPVKYQDAIGTREASVLEESNSIDMGPSPITGQVSKSMTKSRMTGAGGVISLDFAGLPQHLHQVVHYITHYEAVRNFDKLRRKSEFRAMYESYFDANGYKQLRSWLQNIATNGTIAQTSHDASKTMDTIFRRARFGGSLLGLGWKVSSAVMQVLGTGPAAKEVGAVNMAGWLLKLSYGRVSTTGQARVHPDYQRALDASPELRHLDSQMDRDIREFTDNAVEIMRRNPGTEALHWVRDQAFYLIIATQKHINAATWLAAHEKAHGEGRTVQESVQYADATVRQTQSGGGLKDLAGLQQGNELAKLVTLFYTYFSVQHNQLRMTGRQDLIKGFVQGDGPNGRAKSLGKFVAANLYIVLVPSLVEALLKYDEDDDDDLLPYLATRIASSYVAGVPIFRDVYSAATRDWQAPSTPLDQVVQSLVGASGGAYDWLTGEGNWTDIRNIAKAITLISWLPAYQVAMYTEALATSDDFGEAVSHVMFGTPYSQRQELED